jgi:hypothetical protein
MDSQLGSLTETMEALIESNRSDAELEKVQQLVYQKSMVAQCAPGEPVGILAAQVKCVDTKLECMNTFSLCLQSIGEHIFSMLSVHW